MSQEEISQLHELLLKARRNATPIYRDSYDDAMNALINEYGEDVNSTN